mmetsp:Transcript_12122/g.29374  ORF Transcript_12122/g.29374 Transcript_12122/m.29374 type:complete len:764 (-) Transcript_12122:1871-4162(-)
MASNAQFDPWRYMSSGGNARAPDASHPIMDVEHQTFQEVALGVFNEAGLLRHFGISDAHAARFFGSLYHSYNNTCDAHHCASCALDALCSARCLMSQLSGLSHGPFSYVEVLALYVAAIGQRVGQFGASSECLHSHHPLCQLFPGPKTRGDGDATLKNYHLQLLKKMLEHPEDGFAASVAVAASGEAFERFLHVLRILVLAPDRMNDITGWTKTLVARGQVNPGSLTDIAASHGHAEWLQSPWLAGEVISCAFYRRLTPDVRFGYGVLSDDGCDGNGYDTDSRHPRPKGSRDTNYGSAAGGSPGVAGDYCYDFPDNIVPRRPKPSSSAGIGRQHALTADDLLLIDFHRRAAVASVAADGSGDGGLSLNETQRESLLLLTMKCANVSSFVRELPVAEFLGSKCMKEKLRQGELERREGVTQTTTDNEAAALAARILDNVVKPLFEMFGPFMSPALRKEVAENTAKNSTAWRQRDGEVRHVGKKVQYGKDRLQGQGHPLYFSEERQVLERRLMTCSAGCMMLTVFVLSRWLFIGKLKNTLDESAHVLQAELSTGQWQILALAAFPAIVAAKSMAVATAGHTAVTVRTLKVQLAVMSVIPLIFRLSMLLIRHQLWQAVFIAKSSQLLGVSDSIAVRRLDPLVHLPDVRGHSFWMHLSTCIGFFMFPFTTTKEETSLLIIAARVIIHTFIYLCRAVLDNIRAGSSAMALGDFLASIAIVTGVDSLIILALLIALKHAAELTQLVSHTLIARRRFILSAREGVKTKVS